MLDTNKQHAKELAKANAELNLLIEMKDGAPHAVKLDSGYHKPVNILIKTESGTVKQMDSQVDLAAVHGALAALRPMEVTLIPIPEAAWDRMGLVRYKALTLSRSGGDLIIDVLYRDKFNRNQVAIRPGEAVRKNVPGNILSLENNPEGLSVCIPVPFAEDTAADMSLKHVSLKDGDVLPAWGTIKALRPVTALEAQALRSLPANVGQLRTSDVVKWMPMQHRQAIGVLASLKRKGFLEMNSVANAKDGIGTCGVTPLGKQWMTQQQRLVAAA